MVHSRRGLYSAVDSCRLMMMMLMMMKSYLFNDLSHAHDGDSDESVLSREAVVAYTHVQLEQIQLFRVAHHAGKDGMYIGNKQLNIMSKD